MDSRPHYRKLAAAASTLLLGLCRWFIMDNLKSNDAYIRHVYAVSTPIMDALCLKAVYTRIVELFGSKSVLL